MTAPTTAGLDILLKTLKLPAFRACYEEVAIRAEKQNWSYEQFLQHLVETELEERIRRRTERNLHASKLLPDKTLATLKLQRFDLAIRRQVPRLCEGTFVERGENVLIFGKPGRGKTHIANAIGHELVRSGRTVLFTPTVHLVQHLLIAKRDLELSKELRRLDRLDVVILDDIGYVQQSREEMEVLFTFLAERYERRSVMITSNLVFSAWDQIFKDPMTTAAAIDRVVHHSTILELLGESYRSDEALARMQAHDEQESESADEDA
ncbi:MAG TPA: IS21-like element helper ATPase IstB [Opitutaceae bacterium]